MYKILYHWLIQIWQSQSEARKSNNIWRLKIKYTILLIPGIRIPYKERLCHWLIQIWQSQSEARKSNKIWAPNVSWELRTSFDLPGIRIP